MSTSIDFYAILGIAPDATLGQIKQAYRKEIKHYHPDHAPNEALKAEYSARSARINNAYDTLKDEQKRKEYDLKRVLSKSKPGTNPVPRNATVKPTPGTSAGPKVSGPTTSQVAPGPSRMDKERPDSRPGQGKDQVAQKKSTQSTTKTKASPAEPAQTKSAVSAPGEKPSAKNNATGPRTSSTAAPRPPPAAHVQLGFGNIGMPFFMGFPPLLNADLTAAGPNATTNDRINAWNPKLQASTSTAPVISRPVGPATDRINAASYDDLTRSARVRYYPKIKKHAVELVPERPGRPAVWADLTSQEVEILHALIVAHRAGLHIVELPFVQPERTDVFAFHWRRIKDGVLPRFKTVEVYPTEEGVRRARTSRSRQE